MGGSSMSVREAVPLLLAAVAGVLLFYSGVFAVLFAVPVQVIFTKDGPRKGIAAAGATAVAIVVFHLSQVMRIDSVPSETLRLLFLDSLMPVGLLIGLAVFNLDHRHPWWGRLIAGSVVGVLGAVPSLRILAQADEGTGPLSDQLTAMVEALGMTERPDAFIRMVRTVALNTIGVGIVGAIAANSWIGRSIVLRRYGLSQSLRPARVPERMVWVVIVGLAVVLATWIGDVPLVAPVGWNALLIGAFFFGVQGVGLIQHLLRRRGMAPQGERWVATGVLILLLIPGVNVVALIGVPLLGMSEVWVDYKRGDEYEGHSEH